MNIAVVLAGGIGVRTGHSVPKQYLTVKDKPIIVYTLEVVQQSGLFDEIYVVCADEWAEFVCSYADEYHITSFKTTIHSGRTRFDTISASISFLNKQGKSEDDVVCFVDSNRPMIPVKTYKETLAELKICDFVFSSLPIYDSVFSINPTTGEVCSLLNRDTIRTGQSPMATRLKDATDAIKYAETNDKEQPLALVMMEMKKSVRTIIGAVENRKITTAEDFEFFKKIVGVKDERKTTN